MTVTKEMLEILKNEGVVKFLNEVIYVIYRSDKQLVEYLENPTFTTIINTLNECYPDVDYACLPWSIHTDTDKKIIEAAGVSLPTYGSVFKRRSDDQGISSLIVHHKNPCWWAGPLTSGYSSTREKANCAPVVTATNISNLYGADIQANLDVYPVLHLNSEEQVGDTFEYNGIKFLVTKPNWAYALQSIGRTIYDNNSPVYNGSAVQKFIEDWFG